MKKFILSAILLLTSPLFGQVTTGYHRVSQVIARGSSGTQAVVVPNANIYVTSTQTGTVATIYSDPLLSIPIPTGMVTADSSGNYSYYMPLAYCVNERTQYPGSGNFTTTNICALSGSGGISDITTSTPSILTITNPTGPTVNIDSTGGGCTTISAGGHCVSDNPTVSQTIAQPSGTDFGVNSDNLNLTQVDAENLQAGTAINLSAGTAINISSVTTTDISSTGGMNLTDNSSSGITIAENGASSGQVSINSGVGGILLATTGTVELDSSSPSTLIGNGSQICTLATGCGGTPGGSGVQYNPTTTAYIVLGSSLWADDSGGTSTPVTAGSWSCNGTICTVNTSTAHNLTTSDWVKLGDLTSWFAAPANRGTTDTGIGTFKVASTPTSTQFTVAYTLNTGSGSGGTIANADYWSVYQTAAQPFLNGHGTTYYRFAPMSTAAAHFANIVDCTLGTPTYLVIMGGQNDIANGDSEATIEANYQSIWSQAHTAGCIVIQGGMLSTSFGIVPNAAAATWQKLADLNQWLRLQKKTFTGAAGGQYWDQYINYDAYGSDERIESYESFLAQRTNEAFAAQGSNVVGPPPVFVPYGIGPAFAYTPAGRFTFLGANGWDDALVWNPTGYDLTWKQNSGLLGGGQNPLLKQSWPQIVTNRDACNQMAPATSGTNDVFSYCVHYAGANSTSNWWGVYLTANVNTNGTATPIFKAFANGDFQIPSLASGGGTKIVSTDASGKLGVTTAGAGAFSGGLGASYQDVTEIAAPANPASGNDRLYTDSTSHLLSCLSSAGTNCMPTGSGPGAATYITVDGTGTPPTNYQALTAGANITLTPNAGAHSMTIAASGGGGGTGLFSGLIYPPTLAGIGLTTSYAQNANFTSQSGDIADGILVKDSTNNITLEGWLTTYPATPFTLTFLVSPIFPGANFTQTSLLVTSSTTGNVMAFEQGYGSGSSTFNPLALQTYSNPSTFVTTVTSSSVPGPLPFLWCRYQDDGTNITYSYGYDGTNFSTVYTVAKASSFLSSSGFNFIGFGLSNNTVAGAATLKSWHITTP